MSRYAEGTSVSVEKSRAEDLLLHLAQLLLTIGRALTAAGTWLYNLTPKGYRQPPRCAWDHDNPNWSDGFYIALGRQEWERRRRQ